jgi:hypothetical protein
LVYRDGVGPHQLPLGCAARGHGELKSEKDKGASFATTSAASFSYAAAMSGDVCVAVEKMCQRRPDTSRKAYLAFDLLFDRAEKKTRRARLGYNSGSRQPHCGRFTSKPVHHVTALAPSNSRRATTDRLSGTAGAGIDDGSRHEAPCQDDCRQSGGRAWPNSSSRPLASSPETTRRAEPPASGFGGLHTPWRLNAAQHRLQLAQGELRDAQTADGRGFSVQHPGKRGAKP